MCAIIVSDRKSHTEVHIHRKCRTYIPNFEVISPTFWSGERLRSKINNNNNMKYNNKGNDLSTGWISNSRHSKSELYKSWALSYIYFTYIHLTTLNSTLVKLGHWLIGLLVREQNNKNNINSIHLIEPTPKFRLIGSRMSWRDVTKLHGVYCSGIDIILRGWIMQSNI